MISVDVTKKLIKDKTGSDASVVFHYSGYTIELDNGVQFSVADPFAEKHQSVSERLVNGFCDRYVKGENLYGF